MYILLFQICSGKMFAFRCGRTNGTWQLNKLPIISCNENIIEQLGRGV